MSALEQFLLRHSRHTGHASYRTLVEGAVGLMVDSEHTESVFDIEDGLRQGQATSELPAFQGARRDRPDDDPDATGKAPGLGRIGREWRSSFGMVLEIGLDQSEKLGTARMITAVMGVVRRSMT
ncbi:MAG: hypothetical protein AAF235_04785 [Planctomycetota bacterium]